MIVRLLTIGKAKAFKQETEERIDIFNHQVQHWDKYYQVYRNDLPDNLSDFDLTRNNSVATLNKAINTMSSIRNQFNTAGGIIMTVAIILIIIGSMFLCSKGVRLIIDIVDKCCKGNGPLSTMIYKKSFKLYEANSPCEFLTIPSPISCIIGAIILAIGAGLLGLAIYLIVFAEVTIKNLQDRVIEVGMVC
jgi:hypothetical protein